MIRRIAPGRRRSEPLWGLVLALCAASGCRSTVPERHEFQSVKMGTEFRLVFYAADLPEAEAAAAVVWKRIDELNACFSDYDPESELAGLVPQADTAQTVSADLFEVLARAQEIARLSDGAFDVTVGPLVRLWRRSVRQEELPSEAALERARRVVGHENLLLDPESRSVCFRADGMRLDLGGIAKGFALDEALRTLESLGIRRALVDGGGDVAVGAAPPDAPGWTIALAPWGEETVDPLRVSLVDAAVATSGGAYRFVEIDGVRYSHLIDPRTGLGTTDRRAAMVVAPDGMSADGLASALCVLETGCALALVEELPGVEARIGQRSGDEVRYRDSTGFAGHLMIGAPAMIGSRESRR